ncbi:unnamed protein product, partial [marine sediment metagenome]
GGSKDFREKHFPEDNPLLLESRKQTAFLQTIAGGGGGGGGGPPRGVARPAPRAAVNQHVE